MSQIRISPRNETGLPPRHNKRRQLASNSGERDQAPIVYVCCEHPLALQTIQSALASDPALRRSIKPALDVPATLMQENCSIVVLDVHSVASWKALLSKWISRGGRAIAILATDSGNDWTHQLGLINLGICGIVPITCKLHRELPMAIRSVAGGQLWLSSSLLREYARQNIMMMASVPKPRSGCGFTGREEQTINFLLRRFSNKQIAGVLKISERTVKYHVTNILHKLNIENRRELIKRTAENCSPWMRNGIALVCGHA